MKKIWSYLSIPATALAVLTGSIAWVVLLRPFYYVQIGPSGVCQASGLTAAQARAAYSDVMDYCLGLRPDFAAGVLPWSQSGAGHFADVRRMFLLNLRVLALFGGGRQPLCGCPGAVYFGPGRAGSDASLPPGTLDRLPPAHGTPPAGRTDPGLLGRLRIGRWHFDRGRPGRHGL